VLPYRERVIQLARLVGVAHFTERFGPPQEAQPDVELLRALVDECCDEIATHLVEEAANSDDVTDPEGAASYLDDRIATLGDLLNAEQSERIRRAFIGKTTGW
jgi:hypothetical protein